MSKHDIYWKYVKYITEKINNIYIYAQFYNTNSPNWDQKIDIKPNLIVFISK